VQICGMAWEGACCNEGFLWIADGAHKQIIKLDHINNVIQTLPSPGATPNALTFDGRYLWVGDVDTRMIYQIATDDGRVLHALASPVEVTGGLAWDCEGLWVVGQTDCRRPQGSCTSSRLLKLDPVDGTATHEIALPREVVKPSALEWVDGILWVGDYQLNRVFKLRDLEAQPLTHEPGTVAKTSL
jgi:sugar lactone lactonase YvrE